MKKKLYIFISVAVLLIVSVFVYKAFFEKQTTKTASVIEVKQEKEEMVAEEVDVALETDVPVDKVWEFEFYKEVETVLKKLI